MRKNRGFTLIELMIVITVIGVLAAVAVPAYQNSLVKGSRSAAQSFMMNIAQREQQYLLDSRSFTNSLATLQVTTPAEVSNFYTIAIDTTLPADLPAPKFQITATPIAGKRNANDGALTLDNSGRKLPANKW